jgi:predicted RNA-binding Zn ribbon-like protein
MSSAEAPGELALIERFVNTYDTESDTDDIGTPSTLAAWLGTEGLVPGSVRPSSADVDRVIAVREALRALLIANNAGEPAPPDALGQLNRQSEDAEVGLRFSEEGSALVTRCGGVDAGIARLLAIVHAAMHDDTWRRLKVCAADDCQWAFYDRSRNRSGTWCTMEGCGNRMKARQYRARHKAPTSERRVGGGTSR